MRYRLLVRYVQVGGVKVSAIGLGTWQFGSREWGYGTDYARREAPAIVRRALELEVNLVDTAELYGMGRSESILSETIRGRRDGLFLATKILPIFPLPSVIERRARGSIARLGVDAVDLYQLHWPNPVFPLHTQLEGMRRVRDAGLTSHVGVSNYSLARWRAAEAALAGPVLSNQVRFNLVDRSPERELLPFAQRADRLVIAYSPLAQGLLSGRYDATHLPAGSVRTHSLRFAPENLIRAAGLIEALREVASANDATPSQVALAWLIRRPNVVAIPGASSVSQVEENAGAADLTLTDDEDARLVAAAEAFRPVRGLSARVRRLGSHNV